MSIEQESTINFDGVVNCLTAGDKHTFFTSGRYLFVWRSDADAPSPPFELPFSPATMCSFSNRLLAASNEALMLLAVDEGELSVLLLVPPNESTLLFPDITHSTFSNDGCEAAITSSNSVFVIGFGTGADSNVGNDYFDCGGIGSGVLSALIDCSAYYGPNSNVDIVTFSNKHLFTLSKGSLLAISIDAVQRLLLEGTPLNGEFNDGISVISQAKEAVLSLHDVYVARDVVNSALTALCMHVDENSENLMIGVSDGTIMCLSLNNGKDFLKPSILINVRTPIAEAVACQSREICDMDHVQCPVSELSTFGLYYIAVTPTSVAIIDRATNDVVDTFIFQEGVCGGGAVSRFGVILSWFPFTKVLLHQRLGGQETRLLSPAISDGVETSLMDNSWVCSEERYPTVELDRQKTLCADLEKVEDSNLEDLPDILRAKCILSEKYTSPLQLDPSETKANIPKKKLETNVFGGKNPNLNVPLKPVTFNKPIRSNGYTSQVPWSVQQAQKAKAIKASKTPKRVPAFSYEYNVNAGPPIVEKSKSNAIMKSKVHSGAIVSAIFDARGNFLVTGSTDTTLHLLKNPVIKNKGDGICALGHQSSVLSVDTGLSHINPLVLTGGSDGCIGLWNPTKREAANLLQNVAGPKEVKSAKFMYLDQLIIAGVASQVQIFKYILDNGGGDLDRGRNLSRLEVVDRYRTDAQHVSSVSCINSFLSTILVWAGSNKEVGVVDLQSQQTLRLVSDAHERPIHSLEMVSNSRFASVSSNVLHCMATSGLDRYVKLWDLRSSNPVGFFTSHVNSAQKVGLCFSPCGKFLVSGSEDRSAYVYDLRKGDTLARLTAPDVVTACTFHPLEPLLALGTGDGNIRFFGI